MDLMMPRLDGIGATKQIMEIGVDTRVIALTSFAEDDQVFPAIQAGASSYLLKDVSPDELIDAIRAAYRGEPRLHPDVARKLMDAMRAAGSDAGRAPAAGRSSAEGGTGVGGGDLTDREREVIRLVAQGQEQPGDRAPVLHQREDGEDPHQPHPCQARPQGPHPTGHLRHPE